MTEERGILSIGKPYDTVGVAILGKGLKPVPTGEAEEIALSGMQLADGHFNAPEQIADEFRLIDSVRWYLTGDMGRCDAECHFHHLGRTDNQIKMKGNRIELEEIEMHLRRATGSELSLAVAWPVEDGSAQGLVGFTVKNAHSADEIQALMLKTLLRYMVPGSINFVDSLPHNANGEVDRKALVAELDRAAAVSAAEAAQ